MIAYGKGRSQLVVKKTVGEHVALSLRRSSFALRSKGKGKT